MRAKTVGEILRQKKKKFAFEGDWFDAFEKPETTGVWFIWGNSGNGKSSFTMQLCKELTKYGKVLYNSLEEADSLTMQNTLLRHQMDEVGCKLHIVCERMPLLRERLSKRNSPQFVVIDSLQYTRMRFDDYIKLKEQHRDKLFIFISHADGKNPRGSVATDIMYDASLKIWVEGYRAISKGRFIGKKKGYYTIWEEGAAKYWLGIDLTDKEPDDDDSIEEEIGEEPKEKSLISQISTAVQTMFK